MLEIARKYMTPLLITILFCLFILPINEHIAFSTPVSDRLVVLSYALKLLFAICFFFLVRFVLHVIERVKARDASYLSWLKFSGIYFAAMLVVFLLIYPGHWVWDEFNILASVKLYAVDAWQNYFTNIFYTFCLYLVPTGVSIVFFQIVFASLVVGYLVSRFQKRFKQPKHAYWLLALFFVPPIILNNFYPLRLTMYSYVELLLIGKLILLYLDKFKSANKYHELLILSLLTMLVSFWRTEGLYYLVVFPVVIVWLRLFTKVTVRTLKPYVYTGAALVIMVFGLVVTKLTHNDRYDITGLISPLSLMIQHPLKGDNVPERLHHIDKAVNLSVVKKYPDAEEVPAYWNGAVREDFESHLGLLKKEYVQLVVDNPGPFFQARMRTFLSTNGFDFVKPPVSTGMLSTTTYEQPSDAAVAEKFYANNYFSRPLNTEIKAKVTKALLLFNDDYRFTFSGHVFWNIIPVILLLAALFVRKVWTKQFFWAFIVGLILARVPLIFITAPANYFMYYLPVYMSGYFVLLISLLFYLESRKAAR